MPVHPLSPEPQGAMSARATLSDRKRGTRMFGGMGNMGNMAGMMKKVQKMQSEMKKMQDELKRKTVDVTAGGGAVKVVSRSTRPPSILKTSRCSRIFSPPPSTRRRRRSTR